MNSFPETDSYRYWTNLVVGSSNSDVDEVGHPDMGREFNLAAYSLRLEALKNALRGSRFLPSASRVFDVGFGVGFYLQFWKNLGCSKIAGTDISRVAWENAKARFADCDLRLRDVVSLDGEDDWSNMIEGFDLVTAIDVMYHIMADESAKRALHNVARLVAPDGTLLITEKFPSASPVSESSLVRRRPFSWYASTLAEHGFQPRGSYPVFWCMDPPVFNSGQLLSASAAYSAWVLMRLLLKYCQRNSEVQNRIGAIIGCLGTTCDRRVLGHLSASPNLTLTVFRRG
jgi:SAM-dependent methyltransferase